MKKISLLVLALLTSIIVLGQSQRKILLEHFTGASCTFCEVYNPMVEELLNDHPDKITSIKYQFFVPDPMYHHCSADIDSRLAFYNNQAAPHSILDGNFFDDHPSKLTDALILERYNEPSPFSIQLHHALSPGSDSVYVDMLIKATRPVSGNLAAYIAVVEKHIHFEEPPGHNGETDFYNVLKKMLPTSAGKTLQADFNGGDYVLLQTQWKLENFYDINELEVIGFVQDMESREIHQCAVSNTQLINPLFGNDLELISVANIPSIYCDHLQPKISIRNNGSETVHNFNLKALINGNEVLSIHWEGKLEPLSTEDIQLDQLNFSPLENNELQLSLDSPNSKEDEYKDNNSLQVSFEKAPLASNFVVLMIKTDKNPGETSWRLISASGELLDSGGPYEKAHELYTHTLTLKEENCYTVIITDSAGNGFDNNKANGYFMVVNNGGYPLHEGSFTGDSINLPIQMSNAAGTTDMTTDRIIIISPNPATNRIHITPERGMKMPCSIQLINSFGHLKHEEVIEQRLQQRYTLDISSLGKGCYLVRIIDSEGQLSTGKFVKH